MITPAYSPTATERVLPRLALDFTTGVLDPRVTVTRALDTATRVNSSGFIETVSANMPRFDYDPVTLQPRGLLIEEQRQNLLVRSAEFNVAAWVVDNVSVNANSTISPDGTNSADAIIENSATSNHNVSATATVTVSPHTYSVFVKPNGRSWVRLFVFQSGIVANSTWFNVSTGTAGFANAGASNVSILPAGNGWYRCAITFTPASAGIASFYVALADANGAGSYAGDGTSGLFVWGAQAEAGAFATSYIPTTTTSLTRNADVVTMTGTNFSDWFNASEGAFVARYLTYVNAATNNPRVFEVSDGTTNNRSRCYVTATGAFTQVSSGGSSVAALGVTLSNPLNAYNQVCFAYKVDSFALAGNGGTPDTDTLGAVPVAPIRINLGSDINGAAQTQLNGYLSKLYYYNLRLLNAEARAFSKQG